MNNHILTVIAICPYMPTSFRDFVRWASLLSVSQLLLADLTHFHRLAIEIGPEENLIEDEEVYEVQIPPQQQLLTVETHNSTSSPLTSPTKHSIDDSHPGYDSCSSFETTSTTPMVEGEKRSKVMLWQTISEEEEPELVPRAPLVETPPKKTLPHTNSLPTSGDNIFSPQEVRKRSSSMKKAGGSTEIAVITRTASHGHSFSAEDVPSPSSSMTRSPEFSLSGRNRSQSERMGPSRLLRRLSSGARLEGAAKAAMELSRLDELLDSPSQNNGGNDSPVATLEGKKASRRSSTSGNYARSSLPPPPCAHEVM
jgi:hypothetical protein